MTIKPDITWTSHTYDGQTIWTHTAPISGQGARTGANWTGRVQMTAERRGRVWVWKVEVLSRGETVVAKGVALRRADAQSAAEAAWANASVGDALDAAN